MYTYIFRERARERLRGGERLFYFKELAHVIMEPGKFKIYREGRNI